MHKYNYLNLGCGSKFHPGWINVDIYSSHPSVQTYDLRKGIPFPENAFDVIYHSNILEHFKKEPAVEFLRQCYRVLKPGGILRVATPDLERLVRDYLMQLENAAAGDRVAKANHEWLMIELLDQIVRTRSGGLMGEYLAREHLDNEAFVYYRIGLEGKAIRAYFDRHRQNVRNQPATTTAMPPRFSFRKLMQKAYWKKYLLGRLLGKDLLLLEEARFRNQGEVHYWLYDRFSLGEVLKEVGFRQITVQSPLTSGIPEWNSFGLERNESGEVYKPDSMYIEAVKP